MTNKVLNSINILLGSLIMLLTGCKTQQKVVVTTPDDNQEKNEIRSEPMICMYGIPPAVYERMQQERDSIETDDQKFEPETTEKK